MYEVTDGKGSHRMGGSKKSTVATGASGDQDVSDEALSKKAYRGTPDMSKILQSRVIDPYGTRADDKGNIVGTTKLGRVAKMIGEIGDEEEPKEKSTYNPITPIRMPAAIPQARPIPNPPPQGPQPRGQ